MDKESASAEGVKGKTDGATLAPSDLVDERGVSWKQRAMENERKAKAYEAEKAAEAQRRAEVEAQRPALPEENEKLLTDFVKNPNGFLNDHYEKRKAAEEMPVAEKWLLEQPHFTSWDDVKAIRREYEITSSSPMRVARAVGEILKARSLEKEFADKKREQSIEKSSPEGQSRSGGQAEKKETRKDLLKQLEKAEKSGNRMESLRLIDKLEDVRS